MHENKWWWTTCTKAGKTSAILFWMWGTFPATLHSPVISDEEEVSLLACPAGFDFQASVIIPGVAVDYVAGLDWTVSFRSNFSAWFTKSKEVFWRHRLNFETGCSVSNATWLLLLRHTLHSLAFDGLGNAPQAKLLATHLERRQVKLPEEFLQGAGSTKLVIPRDEAGGFPLHLFQLVDVLL